MTPGLYTHGLSARILLVGDANDDSVLRRLDWSPRHCGWVRSKPRGGPRWQLRSSAWLTGQRASRSSGIGRRNRRWDTAIASLDLQHGPEAWAIDIETVRRSDIPTLMGTVLGLEPGQWRIAYFRKLERFACISARDAFRLAPALGLREEPVRGERDHDERTWGKACLVRPGELGVPVTIRTRARAHANVVLYQVANGATAGTWKLEARLRRRTSQLPFEEADGQRALDQVLTDIIYDHSLDIVAKPARWEPRSRFDHRRAAGDIAGLPMASWRGSAPVAGKFDTPLPLGHPLDDLYLVRAEAQQGQGLQALVAPALDPASAGSVGLSSHKRSDDSSPQAGMGSHSPGEVGPGAVAPCGQTSSPFIAPLHKLLARRGTLTEIVHSKDDDPIFVANQVVTQMGSGFISCSVITSRTMASRTWANTYIRDWLNDHPLHPDVGGVVVLNAA